ncbi:MULTISPECIES: hypothetical protein [Burkholderia]|uniref:hypothetical protein n=1 Tax=Burkholderia TaxID=32008 RepID=UPI000277D399|nr:MULTISPECIES: hypothetical protein [Burkholderia]AJY19545.1 hypothetical protein NP80_2501 [Burkholderia multivorans ATCC BAA-247]AVR22817.1 hypothetical protein A8H40_26380 [Burkholderia multivorans]EJO54749.1 hypothetical protein BURMUCF1_2015 [Burkholderia multivorans ATCC BAA-247]EJO58059.1 hypothetical protein BURMUCF2_2034 [Burkholderia multivorans CF2]KVV27652.1 hypothetical protein WK80_14115 [Burkholderia multivorans]
MAKDNPPAATPAVAKFLDTRFRSRVIVFPNGDVLRVLSGEAIARSAAQIEYLDAHPDFKRVEERG